jgi:hypothetical protein
MDATIWVAILALPAGYIGGLATEMVRGRAASKQAQATRKAALDDRRYEFEQNTLLEMQAAAQHLVRHASAIYQFHKMGYEELGLYGRGSLPEELGDEASVDIARNYHRLRVRVLDESIRDLLDELATQATRAGIGLIDGEDDRDAERRAGEAMASTNEVFAEAMDRVGERLRSLYYAEASDARQP